MKINAPRSTPRAVVHVCGATVPDAMFCTACGERMHCACGLPSVPNEGRAAKVDPGGFTPVDVEGEDAYRDALLGACKAAGVAPVVCECGRTLYTGPATYLPRRGADLDAWVAVQATRRAGSRAA